MDNKKARQMDAEMSAALFSERERFEMLFADNWKKIAVIGVAIALVIALAFVAWSMTNRAAAKAAYAFSDAADAPALEKALAQYGSKKGALSAPLYPHHNNQRLWRGHSLWKIGFLFSKVQT